MGTCMKEIAYVKSVILFLHEVHAFGVHMSWCMGCMWDICHCLSLAMSDTTFKVALATKF